MVRRLIKRITHKWKLIEIQKIIEALNTSNTSKKTANKLVVYDGNIDESNVYREAPGKDEDKQGLPFVGRAGQLLNKMLGNKIR